MRRCRTPLVLSLSLAALLLSGCESRGWVVQRYPSNSNSNVAAADPLGAALVASSKTQRQASAEAVADGR